MNSEKESTDSLNFNKFRDYFKNYQGEKLSFSQLRFLFSYLEKQSGWIIAVALSALFSAIIILPVPIISKIIIDKYVVEGNVSKVLLMGLLILIMYILLIVVKVILNYSFSILNSKLLSSIKKDMTNKILDLPLSFFSKVQSGYLLSRINEIDKLGSILSIVFIQLVVSSLTFLFSIVILGAMEWRVLLLIMVLLPLQFIVIKRNSGGIQNISKKMMENSANINKEMQEVISGINTVKSFSTEKREKNKINRSIHSLYNSISVQNILIGVSQDLVGFMSNISNLVLLLGCSLFIIKGNLTVGMYVAAIQYAAYIFRPIQSFASAGILLQPSIVAISRINEYFLLFDGENIHSRKKNPDYFNGKIAFQNVSFFYEKEKYIFENISFDIDEGQKVLLAGDNGSGKTTITKLLLQLYMPVSGDIYIDGVNAKDIKLDVLRSRIGIVSQEVFLFNDTVKNNLLYGCDENGYDENELMELVDNFCDFIHHLPAGLDTVIGENGVSLSGGQKQSISIVRTILKHPDILIWDEGNVFLDINSKQIVKRIINSYFAEKTCIFITHDENIIDNIDKTILIKNKKIINLN